MINYKLIKGDDGMFHIIDSDSEYSLVCATTPDNVCQSDCTAFSIEKRGAQLIVNLYCMGRQLQVTQEQPGGTAI